MNLINNALSGSLAAQAALSATSQNIANMATPGYSRQSALLVTAQNADTSVLSAGSGVTVPALLRFSDGYTSQQMWRAASNVGQYDVRQPYLTQMEQVMGDDTANISDGLDKFFAALNAASVEPTSTPLRQQVMTAAQSLGQRFNGLVGVMSTQFASLHQQRASVVSQVNALAADIAALNQKVAAAGAFGANSSSLCDARDLKIDALASLIGIQVVDQPDGSRNVSVLSGPPLVAGGLAGRLSVQGNANGSQTLTLDFAKESFTLGGSGLGGQIGGLNDYEVQVLMPLKQSILDLAQQLSGAVNTTLAGGYGSTGAPGGPLFVFDPTSTTAILTLDPSAQAAGLGFSASATAPGNSDNLQLLIALEKLPVTLTSLGTIPVLVGDANVQLLGKLGTDSQQNQSSLSTAQTVRDQSEATWRSISGVNQDEEAVNLLQYQQMYQANMKVIAAANALFDATLAMMG